MGNGGGRPGNRSLYGCCGRGRRAQAGQRTEGLREGRHHRHVETCGEQHDRHARRKHREHAATPTTAGAAVRPAYCVCAEARIRMVRSAWVVWWVWYPPTGWLPVAVVVPHAVAPHAVDPPSLHELLMATPPKSNPT